MEGQRQRLRSTAYHQVRKPHSFMVPQTVGVGAEREVERLEWEARRQWMAGSDSQCAETLSGSKKGRGKSERD